MIALIVSYICKENHCDSFLQAIREAQIDAITRKEDGNLRYEYFKSTENPHVLLLLERWTDENALKAHCASENFKRLAALKQQYVKETLIEKYVQ